MDCQHGRGQHQTQRRPVLQRPQHCRGVVALRRGAAWFSVVWDGHPLVLAAGPHSGRAHVRSLYISSAPFFRSFFFFFLIFIIIIVVNFHNRPFFCSVRVRYTPVHMIPALIWHHREAVAQYVELRLRPYILLIVLYHVLGLRAVCAVSVLCELALAGSLTCW